MSRRRGLVPSGSDLARGASFAPENKTRSRGAVLDAELRINALEIFADRFRFQTQKRSDLRVRLAARHPGEHFYLPPGQRSYCAQGCGDSRAPLQQQAERIRFAKQQLNKEPPARSTHDKPRRLFSGNLLVQPTGQRFREVIQRPGRREEFLYPKIGLRRRKLNPPIGRHDQQRLRRRCRIWGGRQIRGHGGSKAITTFANRSWRVFSKDFQARAPATIALHSIHPVSRADAVRYVEWR